jgi:hypothetical protein
LKPCDEMMKVGFFFSREWYTVDRSIAVRGRETFARHAPSGGTSVGQPVRRCGRGSNEANPSDAAANFARARDGPRNGVTRPAPRGSRCGSTRRTREELTTSGRVTNRTQTHRWRRACKPSG